MKKIVSILLSVILLLITVAVFAHEKVVVIPLTKSQGDSRIRLVYDNNDVFVGFSAGDNIVVSSTNYFTKLTSGIITGDNNVYLFNPPLYFTSSNCSGNPYIKTFTENTGQVIVGPGLVTNFSYYIPRNTTPTTFPPGNYYLGVACTLTTFTSTTEMYQTQVNDPSITGFQNGIIPGPLKEVYTMPSSP